jgi:hypothetical protein
VLSVVISLIFALRQPLDRAQLYFEILALRHQLVVPSRSRCPRLRQVDGQKRPDPEPDAHDPGWLTSLDNSRNWLIRSSA